MRLRLNVFLIALMFPVALTASNSTRVTGDVLIQNNGPRTIAVFVQPSNAGITHVFHLAAERPFLHNPVSYRFARAEVIAEFGRVTIIDREHSAAVLLAVESKGGIELGRELQPWQRETGVRRDIRTAQVGVRSLVMMTGFELGSQTMPPGRFIASVERSAQEAAEVCKAWVTDSDCMHADRGRVEGGRTVTPNKPATCDSGGAGSTQCSVTSVEGVSCSVTCSDGYTACCKYDGPSCGCVRTASTP